MYVRIASKPMKMCGAKTRSGTSSKNKAGNGTDHVRSGRCKSNIGKPQRGSERSHFKHGCYASLILDDLFEKFEKLDQNPDPLYLKEELALQRTILKDYLERTEKITIENGFFRMNMTTEIVNTVCKIIKIRNETSLTVAKNKFYMLKVRI